MARDGRRNGQQAWAVWRLEQLNLIAVFGDVARVSLTYKPRMLWGAMATLLSNITPGCAQPEREGQTIGGFLTRAHNVDRRIEVSGFVSEWLIGKAGLPNGVFNQRKDRAA
jgi:hypothetical protein